MAVKTVLRGDSNELSGELAPLDPKLLRQLLARVEELLPLPTVVNEILKAVNDPYASLDRLTQIILSDQALTAKILKIINSAFYCLPLRVTTVSQAVPLLGVEKIKNLAMAISLSEGIGRWPGLPGLSRESLWLHGQACAVATRLIAEQIGHTVSEEAMIAGMLHDVAKALWTELFPERFALVLEAVRQGREDPLAAETRCLTVPHATVGSWLLRQWSMPDMLQQAVARHHDPVASFAKRSRAAHLPLCVSLGNLLAKLLNLGDGGNYRLQEFSPKILEYLSLEPSSLLSVIAQLPAALAEFLDQLELRGLSGSHISTAWLDLQKCLADLDLHILSLPGDNGHVGPLGLLCQALSSRVHRLSLQDFLAAPPDGPAARALLEITQPGLLPKLATLPWPALSPVIVCHASWRSRSPMPPRLHCLGPEIRLPELTQALREKAP